jgi:hypothetical protein
MAVNLKVDELFCDVNSPSCEVNLLRSCGTVVVSGGDPTDQRIVPFEVRWADCSCTAINSALEPE